MKLLRKLVLALLLIPILLLLISLFLPSTYRIERSVVIQAEPGTFYPYVANPSRWPEWSAWTTAKDPTLVYKCSGPTQGAGAVAEWEGRKMGSGSMTFTAADPKTGVTYDLVMEHGKFRSKGSLLFQTAPAETRVTWADEGTLGWNPVARFFGLLMDRMVGPDFEEGLRKLKQKAEAENPKLKVEPK